MGFTPLPQQDEENVAGDLVNYPPEQIRVHEPGFTVETLGDGTQGTAQIAAVGRLHLENRRHAPGAGRPGPHRRFHADSVEYLLPRNVV